MIRRQSHRTRGIVESHRGVHVHGGVREQTRLRSRNHDAFSHGADAKAASLGMEGGAELCQRAAARYLQPIDPELRVCTWRGNGASKLSLERDCLPGETRGRSHRRGFQLIREIRTPSREIQAALRERAQLSGARREVQAPGVAGSLEARRDGQIAEARQVQQILERATGRLVQRQARIYPGGIGPQSDLVVARAVRAMCGERRIRILERPQVRATLDRKSCGYSRQLRSELEVVNRKLADIDARETRLALCRCGRLAHRPTLELESSDMQTLDVHV